MDNPHGDTTNCPTHGSAKDMADRSSHDTAGCSAHQSQKSTGDVTDNPEARELLRRASEKTSRWGKDFPGFSADLICTHQAQTVQGHVTIRSPREVDVQIPDEALQKWAQSQIAMMAAHRTYRPFEQSDGRHVLTLDEEDNHPLGRLVRIHGDGMNSYYRVQNDRITQINRSGERMKFTINVEESLTTSEGEYLTTRYSVFYFSPQDGRLTRAENYRDEPTVVQDLYLPGYRRITSAEGAEILMRSLHFQNHKVLK